MAQSYQVIEIMKQEIKRFGIGFVVHYGFREFYPDGKTLGISTNEAWNKATTDLLFKTEMAKHYFEELSYIMRSEINYVFRTKDQTVNDFQRRLLTVQMSNSLILYKRSKDLIRGFFFVSHPKDHKSLLFCANNLQLFNNIIISIDELINQNTTCIAELQTQKFQLFLPKSVDRIFNSNSRQTRIANTKLVFKNQIYSFTPKEYSLLEVIRYGGTIKDIAKQLNISPRTAEWHLNNIKAKIQVNSKQEVATFASVANPA